MSRLNKADIKIPTGDLKKCEDLISEDLMYIINLVLKIIQIGGPILLIIFMNSVSSLSQSPFH